MRGNGYSNVKVFEPGKLEWKHLLLTEPKKERKWRKSFVIFMFIANNSIFKPIMYNFLARSTALKKCHQMMKSEKSSFFNF